SISAWTTISAPVICLFIVSLRSAGSLYRSPVTPPFPAIKKGPEGPCFRAHHLARRLLSSRHGGAPPKYENRFPVHLGISDYVAAKYARTGKTSNEFLPAGRTVAPWNGINTPLFSVKITGALRSTRWLN